MIFEMIFLGFSLLEAVVLSRLGLNSHINVGRYSFVNSCSHFTVLVQIDINFTTVFLYETKLINLTIFYGSDYFKVLFSWPRGPVGANKILVNFDRGSVAAWPRNP